MNIICLTKDACSGLTCDSILSYTSRGVMQTNWKKPNRWLVNLSAQPPFHRRDLTCLEVSYLVAAEQYGLFALVMLSYHYAFISQLKLFTPANTRRSANAGLMLGQRRRRWANNKRSLAPRLVFDVQHVVGFGQQIFPPSPRQQRFITQSYEQV